MPPLPTPTGESYDVLSTNKDTTTPEKIRKAYKAIVRIWNPDKNSSSSRNRADQNNFKSLPETYQALNASNRKGMFAGVHNGPDAGSSRWTTSSPALRQRKKSGEAADTQMPRSASARRPSGHYSRASVAWGSSVLSPGAQQGATEDPSYLPRSTSARRASSFYTTSTATTMSSTTGAKTSTMFFRKKPPPIERPLECTLEELFKGCRKEVRFTRDVIKNGMITRKEEVETVRVKPGWKKGTRVTFEEKGDERPGSLPADVVFVIGEKEHPYFQRMDNDLILETQIPLVTSLVGGKLTFRHLSGDKLTCALDEGEVIPPGHEKVIRGEGMPIVTRKGKRGDLRIRFEVVFPDALSPEKKTALRELLKGCC